MSDLDPRENFVHFVPGHAMGLDHRGDETVWLWCECTPEMPIHVWGDPDVARPVYRGPSSVEIQAAVDAHNSEED